MLLREALTEVSVSGIDRLLRCIPAQLLDIDAEHFTTGLFSKLQKAIKAHARNIFLKNQNPGTKYSRKR